MKYLKSLFPQIAPLNKEVSGLVIALVLFLVFPRMVRSVDASAAPIDPGALSAVLMAVLAVLIFKLATWWIIKAIWPALAHYSNSHFESHFNSLEPWQKITIYLAFYLLLLFSFVAVLLAII